VRVFSLTHVTASPCRRSLETMTAEERSARAKKASMAAAKKRTADRLARERASKRKPKRGKKR
jgi:hypothetical protein